MARKVLQASEVGIQQIKEAFKRKKLENKKFSKTFLASNICSRQTLYVMLKGEPIDHEYFREICSRLDLKWEKVAVTLHVQFEPSQSEQNDRANNNALQTDDLRIKIERLKEEVRQIEARLSTELDSPFNYACHIENQLDGGYLIRDYDNLGVISPPSPEAEPVHQERLEWQTWWLVSKEEHYYEMQNKREKELDPGQERKAYWDITDGCLKMYKLPQPGLGKWQLWEFIPDSKGCYYYIKSKGDAQFCMENDFPKPIRTGSSYKVKMTYKEDNSQGVPSQRWKLIPRHDYPLVNGNIKKYSDSLSNKREELNQAQEALRKLDSSPI